MVRGLSPDVFGSLAKDKILVFKNKLKYQIVVNLLGGCGFDTFAAADAFGRNLKVE